MGRGVRFASLLHLRNGTFALPLTGTITFLTFAGTMTSLTFPFTVTCRTCSLIVTKAYPAGTVAVTTQLTTATGSLAVGITLGGAFTTTITQGALATATTGMGTAGTYIA